MSNPLKQNAPHGGVEVDSAGGLEATKKSFENDAESTTQSDVIANKSTATSVQLDKVIALLRQGPKTTIDLRNHGVMMPAARVFQLKHERNHHIASELVTLYDSNGYRHRKCARYHLIADALVEASA